jgi:DNA polymerase III gamma/tau subunit
MKPPDPELEQTLDALADGLDAGWDAPDEAPVSLTPHSAPLPKELAELDADWDTAAKSPAPAQVLPGARSAQPRPNAVRPSQARPSPTRAVTPAVAPGALPVRVSKKDRRDAERKRRSHEAQQKSLHKKQRKAERREEALRASEQNRLAELERQAQSTQDASPKRAKPSAAKVKAEVERVRAPKRVPKRVRHEHTRSARSEPVEAVEKSEPRPVVATERGARKLVLPLLIALLVAVTLGFALSRAH